MALNAGLEKYASGYDYIARLDCGDLCQRQRIERQVKFLDANQDCYLVGSWVEFTTTNGQHLFTLRHPTSYSDIKRRMFLNAAFTHPAVMFRSSVLEAVGFYPLNFPAAEDYAFFFSIISRFPAQNIPEVLVRCTVDPHGISSKKRKTQILSRIAVIVDNFNFSPYAFYGVVRSCIVLFMPRKVSVFLNKLRSGGL